MNKKYSHLVKPLLVQQPPEGLYTEQRVWMEGKDLEGFNGHFSYGFIKENSVLHPMEGAIVHPFNECLVFVGTKHDDLLYLGAEITIELGEEREEHVFTDPSVIVIPKGIPHGPVTVKNVERPIVHYSIGLAPEYKAENISKNNLSPKTNGNKYSHLIKKIKPLEVVDSDGNPINPQVGKLGPGNADQIMWVYGKDLEGLEVNFTWGFYTKTGIWHRGGTAHTHPEEEILVFPGLNPDDLNYFGAELEIALGYEFERHLINKPSVIICPQGFPHNPVVARWVDDPYGFIVCCLSGEHDSPWVDIEE
ncbi:MAG: hypothetical protein SVV67_00395 [Bacillota bacterium]|nr:hypothetical protein [Bacillota bacterium]